MNKDQLKTLGFVSAAVGLTLSNIIISRRQHKKRMADINAYYDTVTEKVQTVLNDVSKEAQSRMFRNPNN